MAFSYNLLTESYVIEQYAWVQRTAFHGVPEHVFVHALLEVGREAYMARAHVPEKDAERVHVHRCVVAARKKLRRHVDRRAHYRPAHHRLRLAKPQVGDLSAVGAVQL